MVLHPELPICTFGRAGNHNRSSLCWTGLSLGELVGRMHTGDSGDAAMMAVFEEVVAPAARRFQPDIILVSILRQQRITVGCGV